MSHKIFVFVPGFGQIVSTPTFLTTHALNQHFLAKGIQMAISSLSFPDIAELRSMALTIWYDTMPDSSHMLFVDSDMAFPPDMVTDMLMFDEALVGCIYAQRKLPQSWAGSGTGQAFTERRGAFMRVEGVGMGCTLIRRDVVTTMLAKMPHLIDTRLHLHPAGETIKQAGSNRIIRAFEKLDLPERGLVSEDLSFCIRWNQCGGQTWAAIGHKISHVGPFDYQGRYLDVVEAQERAAVVAQQMRPVVNLEQVVATATAAQAVEPPVEAPPSTEDAMEALGAALHVEMAASPPPPSSAPVHVAERVSKRSQVASRRRTKAAVTRKRSGARR